MCVGYDVVVDEWIYLFEVFVDCVLFVWWYVGVFEIGGDWIEVVYFIGDVGGVGVGVECCYWVDVVVVFKDIFLGGGNVVVDW